MSIPRSEVWRFLTLFCQNKHLQVTISESLKGGVIVGLGALLGGLLGGPRGLAIGGASAAICTGMATGGKYKSVINVIKEDLSDAQREELIDAVWAELKTINPRIIIEAGSVLAAVTGDAVIEGGVMDTIGQFFNRNNMPLVIQ